MVTKVVDHKAWLRCHPLDRLPDSELPLPAWQPNTKLDADVQVVIEVVDRKARPEMPPLDKLPGGELCLHDEYIELMEDCWAQDPLARPSFEAVIARLRWTHSP